MVKPRAAHLILLLVFLAPVGAARAQVESREGIALQNQILDLRRQMQVLQDQGARGGNIPPSRAPTAYSPPAGGSGDLVAQLLSRVDALEEQVRQLRGRVDEIQNQTQRQGADLAKRIDDMAFQTQNPTGARGQHGGAAQVPPSPPPGTLAPSVPPPAPGASPAPPVRRTPELSLQEGNAALARRDYTTAEQAAREVLTGNRTSPRAYDAQFLLAQALMGQHQYSQAAIAYDDTYNRARKGAHAPEALLGLANALIAINEKKAACDSLSKLRSEYPTLRPDQRDAVTASGQRAGCR